MIFSAYPSIFIIWIYWYHNGGFSVIFFIGFPIIFLISILSILFTSILLAKGLLLIVNVVHKPKEGIFSRNKKDKDYTYWCLRAIIKKWPIWIARQLNIPIFEIIILRLFGVKIGKNCALHDGWIDTEFIEIADNVKLGQGSLILSSFHFKDKLILKKVIIDDDCLIGVHSVVLPGCKLGKGCILDTNSSSHINQILDGYSIYRGSPAVKINKTNSDYSKESLYKLIFGKQEKINIPTETLREDFKELAIPFHIYILSGLIIIGFSFLVSTSAFFLYVFGILEPYLFLNPITFDFVIQPLNILIILTCPIYMIVLYLIHLFFVVFITKYIYIQVKEKGPQQGIFNRNLDEESNKLDYYHFASFLFKYPIFSVARSPFPWLIKWELRFLGSNQIGKNTTIEETFLHSHINLGNNCYLGTYTHLTNHVVDGVYGEENLTYFGVDVNDNVVVEALTGALPGCEIGNNSTIIPIGAPIKFDKILGNGVYSRLPIKKLSTEEIINFLGGLKID